MAFTVAVMSSAPRIELIMAQPAAPHFMTSGNSFFTDTADSNMGREMAAMISRKGPRPRQDASFLVSVG